MKTPDTTQAATWRYDDPGRGFLTSRDPLTTLSGSDCGIPAAVVAQAESLIADLPALMNSGQIRRELDALPAFDTATLRDVRDDAVIERAFQVYAYLATAYVHTTGLPPAGHIPAAVALPLVALAQIVERPPMLAYASYTLANWQRIDPTDDIALDNLKLLIQLTDVPDAAWFTLVHVDIEARAGRAVAAIQQAIHAAKQDDTTTLESKLQDISQALQNMMASFQRMPEGCKPKVYYQRVRPYMFGFDEVVYRGAFDEQPQSYRGETGAQSTIIPALVRLLGIEHSETGLMQHLRIMQDYMPKPHRDFLLSIDDQAVRAYVLAHRSRASLRDAYNDALLRLLDFRKMHLRFAMSYILKQAAQESGGKKAATGTGGTPFEQWLRQLIDETERQLA